MSTHIYLNKFIYVEDVPVEPLIKKTKYGTFIIRDDEPFNFIFRKHNIFQGIISLFQ
jgi:hypothetical protein